MFYFRPVSGISEDELFQSDPSKILSCIHKEIKTNNGATKHSLGAKVFLS